MDANIITWWDGTKAEEGKTFFERMLDKTDMALELRRFANASQYLNNDTSNYNSVMYHLAEKLSQQMFWEITKDVDIVDWLNDMWSDCQEDIRYMLAAYFENARWDAVHKAELEEEMNYLLDSPELSEMLDLS